MTRSNVNDILKKRFPRFRVFNGTEGPISFSVGFDAIIFYVTK